MADDGHTPGGNQSAGAMHHLVRIELDEADAPRRTACARRVFAGIPSLALLFEVVNWAFVAAAVGWAARAFCLRAERRRERGGGDDDEERGLLDG